MSETIKKKTGAVVKWAFFLLIFGVFMYSIVIRPILWENKVDVDKLTTIEKLGSKYQEYKIDDCSLFRTLTCQKMKDYGIETVLIWNTGGDMAIIGGFDKNQKVVYRHSTDVDFIFNE